MYNYNVLLIIPILASLRPSDAASSGLPSMSCYPNATGITSFPTKTVPSTISDYASASSSFSARYAFLSDKPCASSYCFSSQMLAFSRYMYDVSWPPALADMGPQTGPGYYPALDANTMCAQCEVAPLGSGSAEVIYWPTPMPSGAPTSYVKDGMTFVSPSPYVALDRLAGNGITLSGWTTIAINPTGLKSMWALNGFADSFAYPVELDFKDLNNCGNATKGVHRVLTTYNGQPMSAERCYPVISVPAEVLALRPEWAACTAGSLGHVYDPPTVLSAVAGLLTPVAPSPDPTSKPKDTPAAPTSVPAEAITEPDPQASPTPDDPTPAKTGGAFEPTKQPSMPDAPLPLDPSDNPTPSDKLPPTEGSTNNPDPEDSPAPSKGDLPTQSDELRPSQANPKDPEDNSVPSPATIPTKSDEPQASKPDPKDPEDSHVPEKADPPTKGDEPKDSTSGPQNPESSQNQSSDVGNDAETTPEPKTDPSDVADSQGHDHPDPSSPESNDTANPTVDSHEDQPHQTATVPLVPLPSGGVLVGSSTLNSGSAVTISGAIISANPSGDIVVSAHGRVQTHTVPIIAANTGDSPDSPAPSAAPTNYITLGGSGPTTEKPSVFTVGSETITTEPSGIVVGDTTVTAGGQAMTINNTPISIGKSGFVIGSSTHAFATPSASGSVSAGVGDWIMSALEGGKKDGEAISGGDASTNTGTAATGTADSGAEPSGSLATAGATTNGIGSWWKGIVGCVVTVLVLV